MEIIMEHLQPTKSAINAISVLKDHYVVVFGAAMNGVCALSQGTKRLSSGDVIGWDTAEWIPATNKEIYNWLGY